MSEVSRQTRFERDLRASGKKRVSTWLEPEEYAALLRIMERSGLNQKGAIALAIRATDSA